MNNVGTIVRTLMGSRNRGDNAKLTSNHIFSSEHEFRPENCLERGRCDGAGLSVGQLYWECLLVFGRRRGTRR